MSSRAKAVRIMTSTLPSNKVFVAEVTHDGAVLGKGSGKSKKEAEQQAAREALELMGY